VVGIPSIIFTYDIDLSIVDFFVNISRNQWFWRLNVLRNVSESKLSCIRVYRICRSNHFNIPVNSIFGLCIRSEDVIHSVSIPTINVHLDATPGRSCIIGVNSILSRIHSSTCQELCRWRHSRISFNIFII
jgi:heme/copper-type cytochrome/quinol oxidase subunit 2